MGQLIKNRHPDMFGDGNTGGYTYTIDISDGESDVVKLHPSGRGLSLGTAALICGSNTGRIDATLDSFEMIDNGTAVWIPWDKGEVTGTEIDTFQLKISALKAVSVSGDITFKLLI